MKRGDGDGHDRSRLDVAFWLDRHDRPGGDITGKGPLHAGIQPSLAELPHHMARGLPDKSRIYRDGHRLVHLPPSALSSEARTRQVPAHGARPGLSTRVTLHMENAFGH